MCTVRVTVHTRDHADRIGRMDSTAHPHEHTSTVSVVCIRERIVPTTAGAGSVHAVVLSSVLAVRVC